MTTVYKLASFKQPLAEGISNRIVQTFFQ